MSESPLEDFEEEYWDDDDICPECLGTGVDKYTDGLMPCPLCQGEQRS